MDKTTEVLEKPVKVDLQDQSSDEDDSELDQLENIQILRNNRDSVEIDQLTVAKIVRKVLPKKPVEDNESTTTSVESQSNSDVVVEEVSTEETNGKTEKVEEPAILTMKEIKQLKMLNDGYVALKYPRSGKACSRQINIDPDLKVLRWYHMGEHKSSGSVKLSQIVGVNFGRKSKVFSKHPGTPEQTALSFSIIAEKRTVDLEASDKAQMEYFINDLVAIMTYIKAQDEEKKKGKK